MFILGFLHQMSDFKQKLKNASIGAGVGAIIGAVLAMQFGGSADDSVVQDENAIIVGEHAVRDPDLRDLLLDLANTRSLAPVEYKDIVRQFNDLVQLAEYVETNEVTSTHMLKGNRIATLTKLSLSKYKEALANDQKAVSGFNDLESKLNAAVDDRIKNIVSEVSAKM
jgi:hypothetical protein